MRRVLVGFAVAISLHVPAAAAAPPGFRADVLRGCSGFSDGDIGRLDRGEAISRTLPAQDRREIAVAGALRMNVPSEFFLTRFRDIASFKRSNLVLQIGKFSDPPAIDDLAPLTMDAADIEDIRRCRVGDCGVKLPAGAIERFRLEVDWSRPDAARRAEDLAKRMLLEQTLAYLDGGDGALAPTHDKRRPVSAAQEFRLIMPALACPGVPTGVREYLNKFPHAKPPRTESFVYWSKESFGLKSLVSTTQVMIFFPAVEGATLIASRGLYSSHYLDGSISLTWLLDVGTQAHPAIDVVYVNRSRVDAFGGPFGRLAKAIAAGRQRDGMIKELTALKGRVEGWLGS